MRVFMTGGTGYIGRAIVRCLQKAGHQVTGLVRSEERAALLRGLGGLPVVGDLKDPSAWAAEAADHEAYIHAGLEPSAKGPEADRKTTEALIVLARTGPRAQSLIYTSGVWVLGEAGREAADEHTPITTPIEISAWRPEHERIVLGAADERLATAVIRPGMVYGGSDGLVSPFFATAAETDASEFVGDGTNRWCFVHRDDLAELYRLVVEKRGRGVFHGVSGVSVPVAEAAHAASMAAGKEGATRKIPLDEARGRMGPVADAFCVDQEVATRRAAEVGWQPRHVSFLENVPAAFKEWKAGREGGQR